MRTRLQNYNLSFNHTSLNRVRFAKSGEFCTLFVKEFVTLQRC